jgi:hypothetical protein
MTTDAMDVDGRRKAMAEYIEREALMEDIESSVRFTVRDGVPSAEVRGANKIVDRIKCAPAADVVEVVRCKDRERRSKSADLTHTVYCHWLTQEMRKTDFCSYGKRRDNDAND